MYTAWIGELPQYIEGHTIRSALERKCGSVASVSIRSAGSKTFAFVSFHDARAYDRALDLDGDSNLFKREIAVQEARSTANPTDSAYSLRGRKGGGKKGAGKSKGRPYWDDLHDRREEMRPEEEYEPGQVWVGGLPDDITEEQLHKAFKDFGDIEQVELIDRSNATSAIIDFHSDKAADDAIAELDGSDEFGQRITVKRVILRRGSRAPLPSGGIRLRSRSRDKDAPSESEYEYEYESDDPEKRAALDPLTASVARRAGGVGSLFAAAAEAAASTSQRTAALLAKKRGAAKQISARCRDEAARKRAADRALARAERRMERAKGKSKEDPDADVVVIDEPSPERPPQKRPKVEEDRQPQKKSRAKEVQQTKNKARVRDASPPKTSGAASKARAKNPKVPPRSSPQPKVSLNAVDESIDSPVQKREPHQQDAAAEKPSPKREARHAETRPQASKKEPAKPQQASMKEREEPPRKASNGGSKEEHRPREERHDRKEPEHDHRDRQSDKKDDHRDHRKEAKGDDRGRSGREDGNKRDDRNVQHRSRSRSRRNETRPQASPRREHSPRTVKVENLPPDMTLEELREAAEDFGKVQTCKISKAAKNGGLTGIVEYVRGEDMKLAMRKLHHRRVEGWDKRLKACVHDV